MLKPVVAIAAVLAASALLGPTVSQAAESNSVRVSYADLNLASNHGQQSLQRRIGYAAVVVCEIEDSRELALAAATNACRNTAIGDARPAYEAAVAAARHPSVEVIGAAAIMVVGR
jgi:UrcA family protein